MRQRLMEKPLRNSLPRDFTRKAGPRRPANSNFGLSKDTREAMAVSDRPMILHTRVVTGAGGGPEKTILNSPRLLIPFGYDVLCGTCTLPATADSTSYEGRRSPGGPRCSGSRPWPMGFPSHPPAVVALPRAPGDDLARP